MHTNNNAIDSNYAAVRVGTVTTYPKLLTTPVILLSSCNLLLWGAVCAINVYEFVKIYNLYLELYIPWYFLYQIIAATDYLISGCLGISAAKKPTTGLLVSSMVFTVFSICSATGMVIYNFESHDRFVFTLILDAFETLNWCTVGLNVAALLVNNTLLLLLSIAVNRRTKVGRAPAAIVTVNQPVPQFQYGQQHTQQSPYSQQQQPYYSYPKQAIYSQPQQTIYSQPQRPQQPQPFFPASAPSYIPRDTYQTLSADRLTHGGSPMNVSNTYESQLSTQLPKMKY